MDIDNVNHICWKCKRHKDLDHHCSECQKPEFLCRCVPLTVKGMRYVNRLGVSVITTPLGPGGRQGPRVEADGNKQFAEYVPKERQLGRK
jgi:hypothetical protein